MWHRSEFYTHSRTTMKAWVLRWMTFSDIGVTAARKPGSQHNEKKRKYPRFDLIRVDPTANLICMENSQLPHSECKSRCIIFSIEDCSKLIGYYYGLYSYTYGADHSHIG